jgi:hypothetical protein
MRRPLEIGVVARVVGLTLIGGKHLRLVGCRWSPDHTRVSCRVAGGGSCGFGADGTGECSGSTASGSWFLIVGSDSRH